MFAHMKKAYSKHLKLLRAERGGVVKHTGFSS